jgi:hypothetical protein
MVTPCNFFAPEIDLQGNELESGERRYIFGYERISDEWWFFEEEAYQEFIQEIIQDDPLRGKKHTIVMHFEMRANPINCCKRSCPDYPSAGSIGCGFSLPECIEGHNSMSRNCPPKIKYQKFYSDSEERERRVKIRAAAGFTMECGSFDFQDICDRVWDEEIDS